jgi:hypothetical protein
LSLLRHNGREILVPMGAVRALLDEQRFRGLAADLEPDAFPLRCHAGATGGDAGEGEGES